MSEVLIRRILEDLNAGKFIGHIITRKLTDTIKLAKVWSSKLSAKEFISPLHLYLINENAVYIAGVLAEPDSIYAFALKAWRGQRYVSTALRQGIFPHLLQQRPVLRCTISVTALGGERKLSFAKKMALAVGFELLKDDPADCRLMMDASRLKERQYIKGENEPLSKSALSLLKSKLLYAASVLETVQTELEYKQGISGYSEGLNEQLKILFDHAEKIEGAWFIKE